MSKQSDTKIDDGGPAFPLTGATCGMNGMSLRDWFVGQALIGFIACQSHPQSSGPFDLDPSQVARSCFLFADAMLAARKGGARG